MFEKAKIKLRRFIARYFYYPINIIYKIKFRFEKFYNAPIIILTPGKTGSSSIYNSLKKQLPNPVFQLHNLSENEIEKLKRIHLNSDRKSLPLHLIISENLNKRLKKYKGKLYIVTIVREPISREISSFMQNINFIKNSIERNNLSIDIEMASNILSKSLENNVGDKFEKWFKKEIESSFSINVFMKSFDHSANFMIFRNGRYNLLLMKMETMDKIFSKAISKLFSTSISIYLKRDNVGEKKYYSSDYSELKRHIKIDNKILKEVINSRYMKHFYSENEINYFKNKWS